MSDLLVATQLQLWKASFYCYNVAIEDIRQTTYSSVMADIFVSYAQTDRARVEELVSALEVTGHSIWWDHRIRAGADFSNEIEREINNANVVIVVWSKSAIKSPWVRDEASVGLDQRKLVSVTLDGTMLDGTEAPLGFRGYRSIDISKWSGETNRHAFRELCQAIAPYLSKKTNEPNTQRDEMPHVSLARWIMQLNAQINRAYYRRWPWSTKGPWHKVLFNSLLASAGVIVGVSWAITEDFLSKVIEYLVGN